MGSPSANWDLFPNECSSANGLADTKTVAEKRRAHLRKCIAKYKKRYTFREEDWKCDIDERLDGIAGVIKYLHNMHASTDLCNQVVLFPMMSNSWVSWEMLCADLWYWVVQIHAKKNDIAPSLIKRISLAGEITQINKRQSKNPSYSTYILPLRHCAWAGQ